MMEQLIVGMYKRVGINFKLTDIYLKDENCPNIDLDKRTYVFFSLFSPLHPETKLNDFYDDDENPFFKTEKEYIDLTDDHVYTLSLFETEIIMVVSIFVYFLILFCISQLHVLLSVE
jgi:hypothetical protein